MADYAQGVTCPHCATLTALSANRGDSMLVGTCASCGSQFARPLNHFFPGHALRDPTSAELAEVTLIGQRTVSTTAQPPPAPHWAYPPPPVDPDPLFDEEPPPAAVVAPPPPPFVPVAVGAAFDPFEDSEPPSPLGDPPAVKDSDGE